MKTMFREVVQVDDGVQSFMLTGPILHVASRTPYHVEFWYEHTENAIPTQWQLIVVGTGHSIPPGATYVGTALDGSLVWHLYRMP